MTQAPSHAGLVPASTAQQRNPSLVEEWTPEQVRGDGVRAAGETQKLLGIGLEGSVG
jgi:hypothetical protein